MNIIIKKLSSALLITTALLFINAKCNKDATTPCFNSTAYSFKMTTELLNEKEVYSVNDTITLISTIPKLLIDYTTPYPKEIDYSNCTGIGGSFRASLLDSVNHQSYAAIDSFRFVSIDGSVNDDSGSPTSTRSLYFTETATNYKLKILIILLCKGNYQITVNDFGSRGIPGEDCTNAGFSNKIINTNKHLEILSNTEIPGVMLDQYLIDHIYCFRVQ